MVNYFQETWHGLRGLVSGLSLTLRRFLRFDQVITQPYPENRATLQLPPRFRGKLELVIDPATGRHRCTVCGLCVRACPNNSIVIDKSRDPITRKFRLDRYEYHFERCTLCGLCVEACHFGALRFGPEFETAVFDRAELTQVLNRPEPPVPPAALPDAAGRPAANPAPATAPAATHSAPA